MKQIIFICMVCTLILLLGEILSKDFRYGIIHMIFLMTMLPILMWALHKLSKELRGPKDKGPKD